MDERVTRCYSCHVQPARYLARLDWTEGLMKLCVDCTAAERDWAAVVWVRDLTPEGR